MEAQEIRSKVKDILAGVTGWPPEKIADDARFVDDLGLDSLSILEIGVDVDYAFKLGLPEEKLQEVRSVGDAVELVREQLEAGEMRQEVA